MDPTTEALVAALRQYLGAESTSTALVFGAASLGVYLNARQMRAAWREGGAKALVPILLRLVAVFSLALFLGARVAAWTLDRAINNAVLAAVFYPLAMFLILRAIKARDPAVAAQLGADADPTEVRFTDKPPPPAV